MGNAVSTVKNMYDSAKNIVGTVKSVADPLMKQYVTPALLNYGGKTGEKIASAYQTGSNLVDRFLS